MSDALAVLAAGLVLGMRHATDSDHVVAVATIVSRERTLRGAAAIGAVWGLGHTVTILAVGGAVVLSGLVIPERLGMALELIVAAMLVVLGALNVGADLRRTGAARDGSAPATHAGPGSDRGALTPLLRPLSVGFVHGLAGSAAIALLVLSTIHDPGLAMVYLAIFAVGTIFGMTFLTCAMAVPMAAAAARFGRINVLLGRVTGVASICFGLVLAYRIGF